MNTIEIAQYGSDLSSRSTGHALRSTVERLAAGSAVVLDFNGVQSVSHSFADELLAVLVQAHGEEWFRDHVRLTNHSPAVRWAVLDAIQYRINGPEVAA